jgi:hypothetical protein
MNLGTFLPISIEQSIQTNHAQSLVSLVHKAIAVIQVKYSATQSFDKFISKENTTL